MQRGFTLTELLVVIAIIGIVAAAGAPSFSDWTCRSSAESDFTKIKSLFSLSKNSAVNQGRTVLISVDTSSPISLSQWESTYVNYNSACTKTGYRQSDTNKAKSFSSTSSNKLTSFDRYTCFHPDGSSEGGSYSILKTCSSGTFEYQINVFSATSFLEKKFRKNSGSWKEL